MAQIINLTPQPVLVTAATTQNLWEAPDIAPYDMLDMQLGVVAVTGTATTNVVVRLITSMQRQMDDTSWIAPSTNFAAIASGVANAPPAWQIANFNMNLLRYLRWQVATLGGLTNMTISIRGLGRKYGNS